MSEIDINVPTSLSTMLGSGDSFDTKGKSYTVKPMSLEHIEAFMADNLSIGSQLFNVSNKDSREKVDKWLSGYAFNNKGEPMSLEKVMADDWDIVDLKNFFRKLCDLSG